jgi:hypothetical protein
VQNIMGSVSPVRCVVLCCVVFCGFMSHNYLSGLWEEGMVTVNCEISSHKGLT